MSASTYYETVQRLYIAFYQRPADPAGMRYWAGLIDAAGGDQTEAIKAFADSEESAALYGPIDLNTIGSVIDAIYEALFSVEPDAEGKQFYVDGFTAGTFSAGSIALNILNGASGNDALSNQNKLQVANSFTSLVDGRPLTDPNFGQGSEFAVTYAGDGDVIAARDLLKAVTSLPTTVLSDEQLTIEIQTEIADSGDSILDSVQTYSLTADAPAVTEGDSGSKVLTFTLTLDKEPTSAITVNYQNLTSGTATVGDDFVATAGAVTFAAGQTVATVAVTITGDTDFEADETVLLEFSSSSLSASVTATGTINNNDVDISNVPQSFTLTSGADIIPELIGSNGTSNTDGDDTISAVIQNSGTNGSTNESTLNSTDSLNTGSGTDELNVRVVSLTGAATIVPVLTSVDTVSVSSVDSSGNTATINLVSSTGTTTVEFSDTVTGSDTTFLNVVSTAVISLDNTEGSSQGQKVNFASESDRSGTSDSFTISIANGSGSSSASSGFNLVSSDGTSDDTSFEIVNMMVSGTSSFIEAGTAAAGLTSVNVTGAATDDSTGYGLVLTQADNFPVLMTVDASGMSEGGVNIDSRGSTASDFSFIGSASDDRVVLANTTINTAGTLNGGLGKDILATTSFNVTASVVNNATDYEVLEAVNASSSLTADDFTSINEFLFSGGEVNGRLNITGVESDDRFVFSSDQGSSDEAVRFTSANVGNTLLFEMRASSEAGGEVEIVANSNSGSDVSAIGFRNGFTSVTIDSTGENTEANLIESIDRGSNNYYAINNENGLASFTITGTQDLTIGANVGVEMSSSSDTFGFSNSVNVNASDFEGDLRIAGSGSDDVITGGDGNDIIYGLGGADSLTGGNGSDQFRMVGTSGTDVIEDFVNAIDKIGFDNVDFGNTTATEAGETLSSEDYISNRSNITSLGTSDDNKVIELQSSLSTSQVEFDAGADITAYVLVFNSTTNKAELWFDEDWSTSSSRSHVATFDDVIDLVGVTNFENTDFVEFFA